MGFGLAFIAAATGSDDDTMADYRKILDILDAPIRDRRGVSSAEYAILAVGVAVVVGTAVIQFSLVSPLTYAGAALTSEQASLTASAR